LKEKCNDALSFNSKFKGVKMRKILTLLITLFALISFSGCGNVSTVKDGTLEFDKSLTVGKAFDNYKYFKSVKWSEITTENGKKVVQIDGIVDFDKHPKGADYTKIFKEAKVTFQFTVNEDSTFQITYCGFDMVKIDGEKTEYKANKFEMGFNLKQIYNNEPI
jgi:hypothetical protein